jgi:monovalent cation:H+ antiporter-2, CPA2 family
MEIPILQDIVVILGLSVVVIYLFQRLKLPAILGLLITGVIAGPNGLSLVRAVHEVETMAEIGVILLLFIIGLEFSLKTLASIKREVLLGGSIQVGGTIGLVFLIAILLGYEWNKALFMGFLVSLSSTAIILKLLQEKGETNAPHGRISLGILIFQDIIVVPMMLLTPLLAGQSEASGSLWLLLLKAVVVVVAVLYGASYLIPRILHAVAKTKNRELFILTVIVICLVVAWGTNQAGLSLALGAFLAGLIISESEYSYQATGIVLPLREIFTSFFFVSIGMLLDVRFLIEHLGVILLLVFIVALLKFLVVSLAVFLLGYPRRTTLITALTLFQVGEFSFILAGVGMQFDMLDGVMQQYFLATSILTMALTPFVVDKAATIVGWWIKQAIPEKLALSNRLNASPADELPVESLKDHIIIIGYGLNGQNVAKAARNANIPYVVLDVNPENVQLARREGVPVYFGDATNEVVLEHLRVYSARVAVVTITDPAGAKQIVQHIRNICNTVHIIVRTHYVRDTEVLYALGASEVVPEEFETSIEIFTRVLHKYLVPEDEIEDFIREVRTNSYKSLRPNADLAVAQMPALSLPDINVTCLKVQHDENDIVGKTLREPNLRARYGITIAAIERGNTYISDILPDTQILKGDKVYVLGPSEALASFGERVR